MKGRKEEDGESAEEQMQSGLGSLGLPLIILSFAAGHSEQVCWLPFTFDESTTVLSLFCS